MVFTRGSHIKSAVLLTPSDVKAASLHMATLAQQAELYTISGFVLQPMAKLATFILICDAFGEAHDFGIFQKTWLPYFQPQQNLNGFIVQEFLSAALAIIKIL